VPDPGTGTTLRRLADLSPATLGLMHGPSFTGDSAGELTELARQYEERLQRQGETYHPAIQRPEAARIT
jgi:hypothetical protein